MEEKWQKKLRELLDNEGLDVPGKPVTESMRDQLVTLFAKISDLDQIRTNREAIVILAGMVLLMNEQVAAIYEMLRVKVEHDLKINRG